MPELPGMQDAAIIAVVVLTSIACIVLFVIFVLGKRQSDDAGAVFDKNQDLRLFNAKTLFLIPRPQRSAWFAGLVVMLLLLSLLSWTSQRDEAALAAERQAATERELVRLGCPPAQVGDSTIVVLTLDTSADAHTAHGIRTSGCARITHRAVARMQRNAIAGVIK